MKTKKIFFILLKSIQWILLGIVAFVVLYFITAFCLSRISISAEETNAPKKISIYIITNGDHTDIAMPVRNEQMDWSKEIKYSNTLSKDSVYEYIAIGWGDKGFYLNTPTWSQLKFSVAFDAVFGLNTSAMHTTYYKKLSENKDCRRIMISKEQYDRLINFVEKRFRKNAEGHFINIKTTANYNKSDAFYEAKGRYNLFYTCNTWANDALKACGQKSCVWTIFDTGIFLKYK